MVFCYSSLNGLRQPLRAASLIQALLHHLPRPVREKPAEQSTPHSTQRGWIRSPPGRGATRGRGPDPLQAGHPVSRDSTEQAAPHPPWELPSRLGRPLSPEWQTGAREKAGACRSPWWGNPPRVTWLLHFFKRWLAPIKKNMCTLGRSNQNHDEIPLHIH